jgi:hypothetical protein
VHPCTFTTPAVAAGGPSPYLVQPKQEPKQEPLAHENLTHPGKRRRLINNVDCDKAPEATNMDNFLFGILLYIVIHKLIFFYVESGFSYSVPQIQANVSMFNAKDVENICDRVASRTAAYMLGLAVDVGYITSPYNRRTLSPPPTLYKRASPPQATLYKTAKQENPSMPKTGAIRSTNTWDSPILLDDCGDLQLGHR